MEFPEAGENCSAPECKTLDFLPVSCSHCGLIFCKTHFSPLAHQCKKAPDNVVSVPKWRWGEITGGTEEPTTDASVNTGNLSFCRFGMQQFFSAFR
ncbi:unnamed protein product, partial [Nesidiocoris tenuis]